MKPLWLFHFLSNERPAFVAPEHPQLREAAELGNGSRDPQWLAAVLAEARLRFVGIHVTAIRGRRVFPLAPPWRPPLLPLAVP